MEYVTKDLFNKDQYENKRYGRVRYVTNFSKLLWLNTNHSIPSPFWRVSET